MPWSFVLNTVLYHHQSTFDRRSSQKTHSVRRKGPTPSVTDSDSLSLRHFTFISGYHQILAWLEHSIHLPTCFYLFILKICIAPLQVSDLEAIYLSIFSFAYL